MKKRRPKFVRIPLHGRKGAGLFTVVDVQDKALALQYRWWAIVTPRSTYAHTTVRIRGVRRTRRLHRLIMRCRTKEVDHEDGNGLNNRRKNLRKSTRRQNAQNQRKRSNNTTGFKGVHRYRKYWTACIQVRNRQKHLGCFPSAVAAARAYDAAARKYHGRFARPNFPRRGEQQA